jgi:hypothetical protein
MKNSEKSMYEKIVEIAIHNGIYFPSAPVIQMQEEKDLLEHDSMDGDNYIWAFNRENKKSVILETGRISSKHSLDGNGQYDHFFALSLTGINRGDVFAVSRSQAMDFVEKHQQSPDRVPRRLSLVRQMDLLLFPGCSAALELSRTKMMRDFQPKPGDKTAIKITTPRGSLFGFVSVELVRVKCRDQLASEDRVLKYDSIADKKAVNKYNEEPGYYLITTTQDKYATVDAISERAFEKARMSILEKSVNNEIAP